MTQPAAASGIDLLVECARVCGKYAAYHKDRCPLYERNCVAMDAIGGHPTFPRCESCGRGKLPDSRRVCMVCRLEAVRNAS